MAEGTDVNVERQRIVHDFLNMSSDAYVHGAYETTMELYHLYRRVEFRGSASTTIQVVLVSLLEVISGSDV